MSELSTGLRRTVLAAVIVATLAACGGDRSEAEHLQAAAAFSAEAKHSAAVIEYKNALQQNPNNAQTRQLLAASYLAVGDGASAEKELRRAAELGAAAADTQLPLVKALMLQGKLDEVVKQTAQLGSLPQELRIHLHILRGQALVSLDRQDEARIEFEAANELNPQAPLSRLGQAYVTAFNDQTDAALKALEQLLAEQPQLEEALLLKGRLQSVLGRGEASAETFAALIKLAPQVMGYRLLYAESLIQANRYDDAKVELERLAKMLKQHPMPKYYLAVIAFHDKECDKVISLAGDVLAQLPQHLNSRLLTGYCHYQKGNMELAYEFLQGSAPRTPENHMARKVLALTAFKLGHYDAAADALRGYTAASDADYSLFSELGGALLQQGQAEAGKELLERASQHDQGDATARMRLGMAKLALDDDTGLTDLEQAMEAAPEKQAARVVLALNLVRRGRVDEAVKLADEWLAAEPQNADALNLSAMLAREQGKMDKAKALLQQALAVDGDNRNSHAQLLQLALQAEDQDGARQQIKQLLKASPVSPQLLALWYALEQKAGDVTPVTAYLQQQLTIAEDAVPVRLALASILLREQKAAEVEAMLTPVDSKHGGFGEASVLRAQAWLAQGKPAEAEKIFRSWRETKPDDARSYLALAEFYQYQRQLDKALAEVRSGLTVYPKGSALLLMRVQLELDRGDINAAADALATVDREKITSPHVDELRGRIALAKGDKALALSAFGKAVAAEPTPARRVLLAQAQIASGQQEEARQGLEAHLVEAPDNTAARNLFASLFLATDAKRAEAEYRTVLAKQPDNLLALNNLAWLLGEQNRLADAIPLAERALKQMPNNPMVLDTLGSLYLKSGDMSKAVPMLARAAELLPRDPQVLFNYAQALVKAGDKAKARTLVDQLRALPAAQQPAALDQLWEQVK